jgi:DNA ligase-1
MKTFKPFLLPNDEVDLNKLQYPLLASIKLDGIRAIFMNGELYSRSLKALPNTNLHIKFAHLKEYSKRHNIILDGELYCKSVPFNDLSGIIRSDNQELPDDLAFWCFDLLTQENWSFEERVKQYNKLEGLAHLEKVVQHEVFNKADIDNLFEASLSAGFEGLVLRNPNSKYKFGRATIKENIAYKVKPFITLDAKIIDIKQATEAKEGSEKTINELGYSRTSQKKDDRVLINKASVFVVLYEGKELGVSIAATDIEKEEIWAHKEQYIGRWIEYKGLLVGSKDLPRHPVFIRYRDDKK